MPLIKSAKKKMRQDVQREKRNNKYLLAYKKLLDQVRKHKKGEKKSELLNKVYRAIDQAVKKKVIHKNKGSRLKGEAARMLRK